MCEETGPQVNNRHNILKITKKFLEANLHTADSLKVGPGSLLGNKYSLSLEVTLKIVGLL
jgi:hypothetical protein